MSRWLRRLYSRISSFILSNALRATGMGRMDRGTKHLHNEPNKPRECVKSNKSCKSNQSDNECGSDTDCLGCAPFSCARLDPNSNYYREAHVEGCICSICRDFNEYTDATTKRAEGQDTSTRVWDSDESRGFKQSNSNAARTNIEYITGIPAGTTI